VIELMRKSKIAFIVISILFILLLLFFVIDFSRKTSFPGHLPKEKTGKGKHIQMEGF